jgi:DUF4097 and DUF4098 domain-containing protein YvlB
MKAALLIPVMTASLLPVVWGQDAQIVQEKPSLWRRSYSGAFAPAPARVIRVVTRGAVVLRGSSGDQVTYQLIEHVRARSQEEAHRLFGSDITSMMPVPHNGMIVVTLMPVARENVSVQWEVTVPRRVAAVVVDTQLGDVEAYDLDGAVHIDTTAGLIRCDRIKGGVEANTGGGEIRLGKMGGPSNCSSAAGSITVDSASGDTICRTAGGEIQVHEASGPLTLSTEGGNIQVDRAAGSVEAHTGEGVIQIFQAGGVVLADTRGGAIEVGASRGANCQSAAGTIRVKTSAGPLKIQTAMGSILAELLSGARLEDSSLVAGSGDVTVLIPSNLSLSVVARNDSGASPRILSDFSEVRAKSIAAGRLPLVYEGAINGGGPVLTLNTGGGIIYVRKLR